MIKTTVNMSVKNLKKMYEKTNNLSLDAEMQRGSGQWVGKGYEMKRSLLINSLLNAYPIKCSEGREKFERTYKALVSERCDIF